jgi:hypothetical protein
VLTGNGSYPTFYRYDGATKAITKVTNSSSSTYYVYDASRFMASDLDFDGRPEFFTTSWCDGTTKAAVKVYRYDKGSSQITWANTIDDPDNACEYTDGRTLTDLDGDGYAELVFGNGYAYPSDPSVWSGNIYAMKFSSLADATAGYFCNPAEGACFDTEIPDLYGGQASLLFRIGDSIQAAVVYFTTDVPNAQNASTTRYWTYDTTGAASSGAPATSATGWYPTDIDGDGTLESFPALAEVGLWDVNGDGYPDQLSASGTELRLSLWDPTQKQLVENTPSRLSISGANVSVRGVWDMNGDGRLNVVAADTNGNIDCYQLGDKTWNRGSSLPPHFPWFQRTYQWDNYEPNDGADTDGDGLPDRLIRVPSALTGKGNFYSYLSSASDADYFLIDAVWNASICLAAPKGLSYRLKVYSYYDRWDNASHAPTPDGKKDGLIWTGATSEGGSTCFSYTAVTPYRSGEYAFAIGVEPISGYSADWPYWITATK